MIGSFLSPLLDLWFIDSWPHDDRQEQAMVILSELLLIIATTSKTITAGSMNIVCRLVGTICSYYCKRMILNDCVGTSFAPLLSLAIPDFPWRDGGLLL